MAVAGGIYDGYSCQIIHYGNIGGRYDGYSCQIIHYGFAVLKNHKMGYSFRLPDCTDYMHVYLCLYLHLQIYACLCVHA